MVAVREVPLPDNAAAKAILYQIDMENPLRNYNYILHDKQANTTTAIDPTDGDVTIAVLDELGLSLDRILSTHHHFDHVGGNETLKAHYGCDIVGFVNDAHRIPGIDITLEESQRSKLSEHSSIETEVIDVSGHTIGHIAYYCAELKLVFSGDALFSMGCGRIFEGTAEMTHNSLQKLAALPDDTLCCMAHEYTAANAKFALSLEPSNDNLVARIQHVKTLRANNNPTVPVLLGIEKRTNPFLRTHSTEIRQSLDAEDMPDAELFGAIRAYKDNFNGS